MKNLKILLLSILLVNLFPLSAASYTIPGQSPMLGADVGFSHGTGFRGRFSWLNINDKLPAGIHASFGHFWQNDPGKAEEVRSIFINDNQGGKIEEAGSTWLLEVSGSYEIFEFKTMVIHALTGPRFAWFRGNFGYINDNEVFDVTTDPMGWGAGLAGFVRFSKHFVLNVNLEADYYFASPLSGHGTYFYSPDDEDDNPRTNGEDVTYKYADADAAVNQPEFDVKAFLGISYLFI